MSQTQQLNKMGPPLEICQALRSLIIAALKRDLPEGLYPYQIRISDRVIKATLNAKGDELLVCCSRQSGKTEAIVVSILTLSVYYAKVLKRHFRVGIFAPAGSQAIQIVKERLKARYLTIRPLLQSLNLQLATGDSFYSELFVIRNLADRLEARVRCLSIGERSNVTGETFHLLIIEQAEDADPLKMMQEVFPMSAAIGGARILSGTPKNEVVNTYFYDAITKREDRSDIIEVKWTEAALYNANYKDFVAKEADRIGAETIAFKTQYGLEWLLGVDKFTNRDEMLTLTRKKPWILTSIDGLSVFRIHAGWDIAKESDRGVVTWGSIEGDFAHVLEWMEFEGTDYTKQAQLVAQRCVDLGTTQIILDVAGPGDPVHDMFKKELRSIQGGIKVDVKGIFTNNMKEEDATAKLMNDIWKKKLIDYPSLEEAAAKHQRQQRARFIEEFLDLNKTWKGSFMWLEHPRGEDKHDDYPKSCGLMLRSMMKPPAKLIVREIAW